MPSRKKAKGKARKAAKEAKAKAEESQTMVEVAANQRQERSLAAQLFRLEIGDVAPQKCQHGLVHLSPGDQKICIECIEAFLTALFSQDDMVEGFLAAIDATETEYPQKYAEVYASKLDKVISIILNNGTQRILDGDKSIAQVYASVAGYFEEWIAVNLHKSKDIVNKGKVFELNGADDHTLVQYYRKRIPCTCLDEKYKEVKSIKKMGKCHSPKCSLPGRKVERSKMFYCTRCGEANYCSVACQKSDWKRHKKFCDENAKVKAEFDSKQS